MKKKEILDVIEKDVLEKSQMEKEEEKQDAEESVTVPEEITPMIYDEDNKVPEEVTVDEDKQELMDIEDIKGVGSVTASKLREMGIENIADLAFASAIDIHEKIATTRNTYDFCQNLVVYANKYLHESGIMDKAIVSSSKLLDDEVNRKRFSTGDEMYDKWLGGGFESKAVTELYGRFKSGKTQTCDCVAITTAARGENVLFIDTENSYSPTRINEIAKHKKLDTDKVQNNIKVLKTQSASMLGINIQELSRHIREHDIKLVIVDSIIALHRAEFIGRGNLSTRQGQLSKIMMYLVKAAEHHDIGVIITNQVLESPDPFKHGEFPTGGNVIGHSSTHRIYLRGKGQSNAASNTKSYSTIIMEDSPRYARTELMIELGPYGVRGIDPSKPLPKD
jgi:DNA repair protein RadA